MINRTTRRKRIVQVKTGQTPVNTHELVRAADAYTDTYAFSTTEHYNGDRRLLTEVISSDDMLQLARDEPHLLPARIRSWFDLAVTDRSLASGSKPVARDQAPPTARATTSRLPRIVRGSDAKGTSVQLDSSVPPAVAHAVPNIDIAARS
jgi:hypothetical protein